MLERCENRQSKHYRYYGARGITVAPEWHDFNSFLRDMGICPDGFTIERKDNSAGYAAWNCVWASRRTQMNNTRRNKLITLDGDSISLTEALRRIGATPGAFYWRKEHDNLTYQQAFDLLVSNRGSQQCA